MALLTESGFGCRIDDHKLRKGKRYRLYEAIHESGYKHSF